MIRPRIRRGIIYVTTRDGRAATFGKLFTYGAAAARCRIGFCMWQRVGLSIQNKCYGYLLGYARSTIMPKRVFIVTG